MYLNPKENFEIDSLSIFCRGEDEMKKVCWRISFFAAWPLRMGDCLCDHIPLTIVLCKSEHLALIGPHIACQ